MTDPTPQERATNLLKEFNFDVLELGVALVIGEAVEAALKKNNYNWEVEYVKGVAAERERCAKELEERARDLGKAADGQDQPARSQLMSARMYMLNASADMYMLHASRKK